MELTKSALTHTQLSLWTGQKMAGEVPLYNMILTFQINGALNQQNFTEAFSQLVNENDILKTVFLEQNGIPFSTITQSSTPSLEWIDFSLEDDPTHTFQLWLNKRIQHHFNLELKLFDAAVVQLNNEQFILYLNQHHLITDAWGTSVLFNRLGEIYLHLIEQTNEDLPALPSFNSYVQFEKENRNTEMATEAIAFWKKKILPTPKDLSLFGNTGRVSSTASKRVKCSIGKNRSDALHALALEPDIRGWTKDLSLFNIFLTAYACFLHRTSGQNRIIIGAPSHNRSSRTFKKTPGVFIEVFPIVIDIDSNDSFGSVLQQVKITMNEYLKNTIAGSSSSETSRSFHSIFNYITAQFSDFAGMPTQSEWVHQNHHDPAHYIRLQVFNFNNQIELAFDLNEEVIEPGLHASIPLQFLRLLDAFIADRSQPIKKISLVSKEEVDKSLHFPLFRKVVPVEFSSVVEQFEKIASLHSQQTAVVHGDDSITYQELNERSNKIAHFLLDAQIDADQGVAIFLERGISFIAAVWGILKSGSFFIPIPVHLPDERVQSFTNDSGFRHLITTLQLAEKINSSDVKILHIEQIIENTTPQSTNPEKHITAEQLAYILYTSGSTGEPKGVMISHQSLSYYMNWAMTTYLANDQPSVAFCTSVGFDLTITTLFLPFLTGGTSIVYNSKNEELDTSVVDLFNDDQVDILKLTPAHVTMILNQEKSNQKLKTIIIGGEQLNHQLAQALTNKCNERVKIYNEYGPTEATVGCIVQLYDPTQKDLIVPIGHAIHGTQIFLLDDQKNHVPKGATGEIYIAGPGIAKGYFNDTELTNKYFQPHYSTSGQKMYQTGDLARLNNSGSLVFLGRADDELKVGGRRVQPREIENVISEYPGITSSIVAQKSPQIATINEETTYCSSCGLPSNYPGISFNEKMICNVCQSFENYKTKAQVYFKELPELQRIFREMKKELKSDAEYDCIALLSGGKDSTYTLAQLVEMGLKVLSFTLDNGYISEEAKANIRRVCKELNVDHVFGQTEAMNKIFVDSLERHHNVCDGCFKTIYTLSMQIAVEKNIPFIVTGLSRGQFFETRLTEELFWDDQVDVDLIDDKILQARKDYHQVDDAVKKLLDTSIFENDQVFKKVRFLDFFRYTDVTLDEMLNYLKHKLPWVRPSDTGRSTNCLINKAGIYVHRKKTGFSNYAFPYSWDVRMDHKTLDEALDEVNEQVDEAEVLEILNEIGYTDEQIMHPNAQTLVSYFIADSKIDHVQLRSYLLQKLPQYMVPNRLMQIDSFPINSNGKIDLDQLPIPDPNQDNDKKELLAPRNDIEEMVFEIWADVLVSRNFGVNDNFLHLGGHSLTAIRITSRLKAALSMEIPLNLIFLHPTISTLSQAIEVLLTEEMSKLNM